jgi:hypothetical protein
MWVIGFVLLAAAAVAFPNPIILVIVLFGGFETYRRWKQRGHPEAQRYYRVRPATRAAVAVTYIGLAVALGVGMDLTHLERELSDA